MNAPPHLKIGFLVNPIAGMGGKVGLHGTDNELLSLASIKGAKPESHFRAERALLVLKEFADKIEFISPAGKMGGEILSNLGFIFTCLDLTINDVSTKEDTKKIVEQFLKEKIDIIFFAGGDGTAHDIFDVVGEKIALLGIPAGVKMLSGVFATYPEKAGEIIADALFLSALPYTHTEIFDVVLMNKKNPQTRFFGTALSIKSCSKLQNSKSSSESHLDRGLYELAKNLASSLKLDHLYLFGPGKSTKLILDHLGLRGSLAGVDAFLNGKLIGIDLDEKGLLDMTKNYQLITLFLGVIGGQGFLLGRGNQQLSYKVLSEIGVDNIYIMSSAQKIMSLMPVCLHVDLGNSYNGELFPEYLKVHTSWKRTLICKVETPKVLTSSLINQ